jgi:hypothetical protein
LDHLQTTDDGDPIDAVIDRMKYHREFECGNNSFVDKEFQRPIIDALSHNLHGWE